MVLKINFNANLKSYLSTADLRLIFKIVVDEYDLVLKNKVTV